MWALLTYCLRFQAIITDYYEEARDAQKAYTADREWIQDRFSGAGSQGDYEDFYRGKGLWNEPVSESMTGAAGDAWNSLRKKWSVKPIPVGAGPKKWDTDKKDSHDEFKDIAERVQPKFETQSYPFVVQRSSTVNLRYRVESHEHDTEKHETIQDPADPNAAATAPRHMFSKHNKGWQPVKSRDKTAIYEHSPEEVEAERHRKAARSLPGVLNVWMAAKNMSQYKGIRYLEELTDSSFHGTSIKEMSIYQLKQNLEELRKAIQETDGDGEPIIRPPFETVFIIDRPEGLEPEVQLRTLWNKRPPEVRKKIIDSLRGPAHYSGDEFSAVAVFWLGCLLELLCWVSGAFGRTTATMQIYIAVATVLGALVLHPWKCQWSVEKNCLRCVRFPCRQRSRQNGGSDIDKAIQRLHDDVESEPKSLQAVVSLKQTVSRLHLSTIRRSHNVEKESLSGSSNTKLQEDVEATNLTLSSGEEVWSELLEEWQEEDLEASILVQSYKTALQDCLREVLAELQDRFETREQFMSRNDKMSTAIKELRVDLSEADKGLTSIESLSDLIESDLVVGLTDQQTASPSVRCSCWRRSARPRKAKRSELEATKALLEKGKAEITMLIQNLKDALGDGEAEKYRAMKKQLSKAMYGDQRTKTVDQSCGGWFLCCGPQLSWLWSVLIIKPLSVLGYAICCCVPVSRACGFSGMHCGDKVQFRTPGEGGVGGKMAVEFQKFAPVRRASKDDKIAITKEVHQARRVYHDQLVDRKRAGRCSEHAEDLLNGYDPEDLLHALCDNSLADKCGRCAEVASLDQAVRDAECVLQQLHEARAKLEGVERVMVFRVTEMEAWQKFKPMGVESDDVAGQLSEKLKDKCKHNGLPENIICLKDVEDVLVDVVANSIAHRWQYGTALRAQIEETLLRPDFVEKMTSFAMKKGYCTVKGVETLRSLVQKCENHMSMGASEQTPANGTVERRGTLDGSEEETRRKNDLLRTSSTNLVRAILKHTSRGDLSDQADKAAWLEADSTADPKRKNEAVIRSEIKQQVLLMAQHERKDNENKMKAQGKHRCDLVPCWYKLCEPAGATPAQTQNEVRANSVEATMSQLAGSSGQCEMKLLVPDCDRADESVTAHPQVSASMARLLKKVQRIPTAHEHTPLMEVFADTEFHLSIPWKVQAKIVYRTLWQLATWANTWSVFQTVFPPFWLIGYMQHNFHFHTKVEDDVEEFLFHKCNTVRAHMKKEVAASLKLQMEDFMSKDHSIRLSDFLYQLQFYVFKVKNPEIKTKYWCCDKCCCCPKLKRMRHVGPWLLRGLHRCLGKCECVKEHYPTGSLYIPFRTHYTQLEEERAMTYLLHKYSDFIDRRRGSVAVEDSPDNDSYQTGGVLLSKQVMGVLKQEREAAEQTAAEEEETQLDNIGKRMSQVNQRGVDSINERMRRMEERLPQKLNSKDKKQESYEDLQKKIRQARTERDLAREAVKRAEREQSEAAKAAELKHSIELKAAAKERSTLLDKVAEQRSRRRLLLLGFSGYKTGVKAKQAEEKGSAEQAKAKESAGGGSPPAGALLGEEDVEVERGV